MTVVDAVLRMESDEKKTAAARYAAMLWSSDEADAAEFRDIVKVLGKTPEQIRHDQQVVRDVQNLKADTMTPSERDALEVETSKTFNTAVADMRKLMAKMAGEQSIPFFAFLRAQAEAFLGNDYRGALDELLHKANSAQRRQANRTRQSSHAFAEISRLLNGNPAAFNGKQILS